MSGFGEDAVRVLTYLTTSFFFLPQFYIETGLIPQKNNRIKGTTISFEELIHFIEFLLLVASNTGYTSMTRSPDIEDTRA